MDTPPRTRHPHRTPGQGSPHPLRARSQPVGTDTRTRPVTPPTVAASSDPPHNQVPSQPSTSRQRQQCDEVPPALSGRFTTLVYPLLVETGTLGFFRAHDGVSKRSAEREPAFSFSQFQDSLI
jgi:hypothetical protein